MHHSPDPSIDCTIRPASADDAAAIAALLLDANEHDGTRDASVARTEADLRAFIEKNVSGALVAFTGGAMAGTIAFAAEGPVASPFGLAVARGFRRRGIGGLLVAAMEREAASAGASIVHVRMPAAAGTIAWLERKGYEVDRVSRDAAAGREISVVDLIKLL